MVTAFDSPKPLQLMQADIMNLLAFLCGFEVLKHARLLSDTAQTQTRHLRIAPLHKALLDLGRLLAVCTPNDYAKLMAYILRPGPQPRLEWALWSAFDSFGPPVKRGAFSTLARYHAIASILLHFGIETREIETVVARLKKTQQRLPKSL
jgi:hypothetical protein